MSPIQHFFTTLIDQTPNTFVPVQHFSATLLSDHTPYTSVQHFSANLFSNPLLQHFSPQLFYWQKISLHHFSPTPLDNTLLQHQSARRHSVFTQTILLPFSSLKHSSTTLLQHNCSTLPCNSLLQHFSTLFPSGQPVPTHETHRGPQCVEQMQSTMIRDYCDRTSLRKACNTRYRARSKHSVQITFTNPTCETTSQQSCEANPKGTQKIVFQVHATRNYAQMQYQPQNPHSERCLKNANQTVNATFKHHAKARVECISQRNSNTKSKCHKRDIS